MQQIIFAILIVMSLSACRKDEKKNPGRATVTDNGKPRGGQGPGTPPAPGNPENKPDAPAAPLDKVHACVEKTCGPASAAHFRWFNNTAELPQFTTYWNSTIMPRVKRINQNVDEDNRRTIARLERFFASPNAKITAEVKGFLQLVEPSFTKPISDNWQKFLKIEGPVYRLDHEDLEKFLAAFPDWQKNALRAYVKQVFMPSLKASLAEGILTDNPMANRAQALFDNMDLPQAVKSYATRQMQRFAAVKEKIPFVALFYPAVSLEILKRAAKGEDLSLEDANLAMDAVDLLDVAYESITGELSVALQASPYSPNFNYDAESKKKLFEEIAKDTSAEDVANFEKHCRAKMAFSYNNQVNADQVASFKQMVDEIRQASKSVLTAFARNSQEEKALSDRVNEIKFSTPLTFADQIKVHMALYERQSQTTKIDAFTDDDIAGVLALLKDRENEKDEDEDDCKNWQTPTLSDAAYSVMGQIRASGFSILIPEVGVAVVAHEFGHVMAHKLRELHAQGSSRFVDSLNCVAKRNPFLTEYKPIKADENTTWSNEDWADHFSSLVILEMKRRGSRWTRSDLNLGCALVESEKNFTTNKLTPRENDPHSSNLLRLLVIGLDRGDLAPECRPLLADAKLEGRKDLMCHSR